MVELLATMVIASILAGMAVTKSKEAIAAARVAKAIGDIAAIQADILGYEISTNALPDGLIDINRDLYLDPWGQPYVYLKFTGNGVPPGARRDRFLVPINSSFDLYSLGPDGASAPPLAAAGSQDDVVRGNDGGFIGLARLF